MLYFILGNIIGLSQAVLIILITLYYKPSIERKINQIASKTKQKGVIIEQNESDLQQWIDGLKKDEMQDLQ